MFRCSFCKTLTQKGEPLTRVPLETRPKTYPFRERANRYSMKARDWPDDPGGKGSEVVKEGQACPRCEAKIEEKPAPAEPSLTNKLEDGSGIRNPELRHLVTRFTRSS